MQGNIPPDRRPQYRHLVLVDGVTILLSVSVSLAIRFGTLAITPYIQRIRLAILLLVFLRLSLFAILGLYRSLCFPLSRRDVFSLIGAVTLSSAITALLVLGLAVPPGLVDWFPRSLLIIELMPGILLAGAVRLGQGLWNKKIAWKTEGELHGLRSRGYLVVGILFIALMAVLLWQALSLAAALLPADWTSFLAGIPLIILSAILFLLPGYALLAIVRPRIGLDHLERLIVSAGLSVAVVPLLVFSCSLAGLPLNRVSVGLIFVTLGALAVWRSPPQMRNAMAGGKLRGADRELWRSLHTVRSLLTSDTADTYMFYATLAIVFLMALLVRLWLVKDLVAPLGSDSVHHAMITQLLVDSGGLFSSWEPYAPLSSFTYHFGFHSLAAFYHWLTGIPVIKSVLIVGQIINALAVPLIFVLTKRFTRNRWAGLIAALIPGFLALMPMYYVNWGRYPQLAGQTILPVAMILTVESLFAQKKDYGTVAITVLALAGLILTHYLVTLMFLCFLLPLLLAKTFSERHDKGPGLNAWLVAVAMVTSAFALMGPWLWNLLSGPVVSAAMGLEDAGIPAASPSWLHEYNGVLAFSATGNVFFFLPGYVFALSVLGAAWGTIQARIEIIVMIGWTFLLLLLANPHVLHLPGTGLVTNTTIMIALYIPASVISGFFVADLMDSIRINTPGIGQFVGIAVLVCVSVSYGAMTSMLTPGNVPVTESDMEAMEWIKGHTDQNATFLVSTVLWEGPQTVIGTNAGWWLPLLTEREGTVPPMIYKDERSPDPHYALNMNAFAEAIQNADFSAAETLRLLKENAVTHVFIGQKGGTLQPASFLSNACYELEYHEDDVWVFEVLHDCLDEAGGLSTAGEAHGAKDTT